METDRTSTQTIHNAPDQGTSNYNLTISKMIVIIGSMISSITIASMALRRSEGPGIYIYIYIYTYIHTYIQYAVKQLHVCLLLGGTSFLTLLV